MIFLKKEIGDNNEITNYYYNKKENRYYFKVEKGKTCLKNNEFYQMAQGTCTEKELIVIKKKMEIKNKIKEF
jgi:hypothetical protein